MIFINNSIQYAKIWKVTRPTDENGNPRKYIELQISTYEKNQDGVYKYSTWYPRVIAHAYNSLKDLKEGKYETPLSLVITKGKLTNEPYVDKDGNKKLAFNFLILEAKIQDENNQSTTSATPPAVNEEESPKDDGCPW